MGRPKVSKQKFTFVMDVIVFTSMIFSILGLIHIFGIVCIS
jgi:hypothetical protein